MTGPEIVTDKVRVRAEDIPDYAVAVTWQRVKDENVWKYRFHSTVRSAKLRHAANGRAYDDVAYSEHGWKLIDDADQKTGVWLW